ncbi:MAG: class I SAM-dependent RNA methyltransferase [Chloroflexi bacterium]|nr:MAG: class I SAM-dependent RNA methyltransferase [Chloroflexota bacterium]
MEKITLIAITKFGLEMLVKEEVQDLGFEITAVSDGRVEFKATLNDIPTANIWLRCADRVQLKFGEFKATTFDDLFEQTKTLPWEDFITEDGKFTVLSKSYRSQLKSNRTCQAIVKKSVVERLKAHYQTEWFAETGPSFTIQVALLKDVATLTLDTSGMGLHRRGYRADAGEAPLKETLAAALVKLSNWDKNQLLIDPMCGSGTILIEATQIARNIAPGLQHTFASEEWPAITQEAWQKARQEAEAAANYDEPLQLFGYDINPTEIAIANQNAEKAGVKHDITFTQKNVKDLWIDQQYGVLISNPPYGIRISEYRDINTIYISLNKTFRKKRGWAVHILTADEKFPDYFKRARPNRVRKLTNGNIKVNYYQFYGDRPD